MKNCFGGKALLLIALLISLIFGVVSCPNNTIQGSVDKDSRNNTRIKITGQINQPLTDSRKFTVTLNNATFRAFSRGEDVSSWFVDENGNPSTIDGLKYRIASPVARGSNKATVRISGTPTEASTAQVHMLIPCDTFQGPVLISIDTENALFYNIIDYIEPTLVLVEEEGNDMVVSAMEGKPFTKEIKFKLQHAYFDGPLSKTEIDVTTNDGDGSIVNANSNGGKLDESTANPFTYTWRIGDVKEGEEHPTEIFLTIKGTADKKRSSGSGDTFAVSLLSSYYTEASGDGANEVRATVYDDFGNPYMKSLNIKAKGEYLFTELKPTIKFLADKPAFVGVADDKYDKAFEAQSLTFRIYDGYIPGGGYTISGEEKKVGGSSYVAQYYFTDDYAERGLDFEIKHSTDSTDEFGSYWEYTLTAKKTTDESRKLTIFEKELPFQFLAYRVNKLSNQEPYTEVLVADKKVSFEISENKPVMAKTKQYIAGMAETNFPEQSITLTIDNSFYFKPVTEETQTNASSLVKVSPMKDALVYSYKIEPDANDSSVGKTITITVKQGDTTEGVGEDEELLTIHASERTVLTKKDQDKYVDGDFDAKLNAITQIEVTFDPQMFLNENKEPFNGTSQVVVKADSNTVRYAIYPLDLKTRLTSLYTLNRTEIDIRNMTPTVTGMMNSNIIGGDGIAVYNNIDLFVGEALPTLDTVRLFSIDKEFSNVDLSRYAYYAEWGTSGKLTSDNNDAIYDKLAKEGRLGFVNYYKRRAFELGTSGRYNTYYFSSYAQAKYQENYNIDYAASTVPRKWRIPVALPDGYTLSDDFNPGEDIKIYKAFQYPATYDLSFFLPKDAPVGYIQEDYTAMFMEDSAIEALNDVLKLNLKSVQSDASLAAFTEDSAYLIEIESFALDDSVKTDNDTKVVDFFKKVYGGTYTNADFEKTIDENGYVTVVKTDRRDDTKTTMEVPRKVSFHDVDIRINPSKFVDSDGNRYLSKKKSENIDNWFRVYSAGYNGAAAENSTRKRKAKEISSTGAKVDVNLGEYIHSGYTLNIDGDPTRNDFYWRIMDRASYAPITNESERYTTRGRLPESKLENSDRITFYTQDNLRHTIHSVSINAGLTTDAQGSNISPLQYGVDIDNKAGDYRTRLQGDSSTVGQMTGVGLKIDPKTGSPFEKDVDKILYSHGSVPLFELASGKTREIPSAVLNNIFSLKRKGYTPAGLAKAKNSSANGVSFYPNSDTLVYKGYNSQGEEEDYSIEKLSGKSLKLPDYESRGHHFFLDVQGFDDNDESTWGSKYDAESDMPNLTAIPGSRFSTAVSSNDTEFVVKRRLRRYTDWNNTTYLYLVWKKNPQSAYYNVWTEGKGDPNEGQVQRPIDGMNFVTIPGDLTWYTYKTPNYEESSEIKHFTPENKPTFNGSPYQMYYFMVDKISFDKTDTNDFVIADRELPGSLWDTVYTWATTEASPQYDFDSSSKEQFRASLKTAFGKFENEKKLGNTFGLSAHAWYGSKLYDGSNSESSLDFDADEKQQNAKDPTHPVVHVNLYDAMLFCNALTDWYNVTQNGDLTRAYGDYTTYEGIRDNIESYIYDSVNKTGFRLPTYSEWMAAATIMPTVDDFESMYQGGFDDYTGLNNSQDTISSYTGYSLRRYPHGSYTPDGDITTAYIPPMNSALIPLEKVERNGITYFGKSHRVEFLDSSYPFMQPLDRTFSGDNENYRFYGIYKRYRLAWYTSERVQQSYNEEQDNNYRGTGGTKPVANTSGKEFNPDGYNSNMFLPNSLGLWDMSGNASEWIISPQESGKSYNVWLIGGDHQGPESMSVLFTYETDGDIFTSSNSSLTQTYPSLLELSYSANPGLSTQRLIYPASSYKGRVWDPTIPYNNSFKEEDMLDVKQREPNTGFRIARTLPKN